MAFELLFDSVGQPQQAQLPQRAEDGGTEEVGQRGVHAFRRVDVTVSKAAPQRLRTHVDELDLVGGLHDGIGDGLGGMAGDRRDDVAQRLEVEMSSVVITSMPPDSNSSTVPAGNLIVAVGEVIDQDHLRVSLLRRARRGRQPRPESKSTATRSSVPARAWIDARPSSPTSRSRCRHRGPFVAGLPRA